MRRVKLGEVAQINPSQKIIQLTDADLVTFVPMEAVSEISGSIAKRFERPYGQVKKGYTRFLERDVLFAKITPCMQNGKSAIAKNLVNNIGFGSTEFHVVRAGGQIIPEWIHFYLRHQKTLDAAVKTFTGTVGQQRVPAQFLHELEMPLPSIEDQRRIAAELKTQLDAVEAARVAACGQLAEVAALKKQVFNHLFSQIQNTAPIGSVAKLQSGYAFKSTTFLKQGTRLLRNANILPGKVYWTDQVCLPPEEAKAYPAYALEKGDVLISLDRPIISSGIKVARVLESDLPALLVQRVGRFQVKPTLLDSDFLYVFLQTQPFIDAVSGHDQSLGVPHVSPKQIESVEMPLPSLSEQKRLAKLMMEITQKSDQAKQAAVQQLADLEQLPRRLLARAFDGKA